MSIFYNLFNRLKVKHHALIKSKARKIEKKRNRFIPDHRSCIYCPYAEPKPNKVKLLCCYVCHLNPLEPVTIPLCSQHSDRKQCVEEINN